LLPSDDFCNLKPVHFWHAQVQEHHVRLLGFDYFKVPVYRDFSFA
jgi:hypothetical protein